MESTVFQTKIHRYFLARASAEIVRDESRLGNRTFKHFHSENTHSFFILIITK